MTDYWVSRDKHLCPQCNIWIQGDRISIRNHEASQKHKDRVHSNAQHRAAGKAAAEREELEKKKQLDDVERLARARFAMDMRGEASAPSPHIYDVPIGAGPILPRARNEEEDDDEIPPPPPPRPKKIHRIPPPPPPRPSHYYNGNQFQPEYAPVVYQAPVAPPPPPMPQTSKPVAFSLSSKSKPKRPRPPPPPMPPPSPIENASQGLPPPPPPPADQHIHQTTIPQASAPPPPAPVPQPSIEEPAEEKSKGFYTVRGVVYLEGQAHESKFTKGKECELWIEEEEAWVPVTISRIFTTTVVETKAKYKHFHVQRRDNPNAPPIEGVRTDALRIPLNLPTGMVVPTQPDQTADFLHKLNETVNGSRAPIVQEKQPGYGGWSTVSVRVVDEDAEEAKRQAEIEEFEAKKKSIQEERDNEMIMEESLQADNAMGAFNPWGGSYKGIALNDDVAPPAEEEVPATGPVAFKKRTKTKKQGRVKENDP